MTPERTDLIEKLKALEPTEGEWIESFGGYIETIDDALFDRIDATEDDTTLVLLAPTMRTAILDMAKEIENLKKANEFLEKAREEWSKLAIKLRTDLERK